MFVNIRPGTGPNPEFGDKKKLVVFLFGDYDFQSKLYGLSGAAGVHPCLHCTMTKTDMQQAPHRIFDCEKRTLETLFLDNKKFVKLAGEKKAHAKSYNNVIHTPVLNIEINKCVPPYLHILLGIVKKHHDLLEKECYDIDKYIAYNIASRKIYPQDTSSAFLKIVEKVTPLAQDKKKFNGKTDNVSIKNTENIMKKIREVVDELPPLSGPVTAGLDNALKHNKIQMQAYHGRSFVGNHCHRYLKEDTYTSVCDSVVNTTKTFTTNKMILRKAEAASITFKELNRLYLQVHQSISHKEPIMPDSYKTIKQNIKRYMAFYRKTFSSIPITPKQHILECHCLPFIKRTKFGLGLLGEQGGEECHAQINILKSRAYGIQKEEDKLILLMTDHQTLVSPSIQQVFQKNVKKNQKKIY